MNWQGEGKYLIWLVGGFLLLYFMPVGNAAFDRSILEGFHLVKWYAREHVILCLVPAFLIAGAISVFVSNTAVMKYLGAGAHKLVSYGVASVSGTVLAVCSCTILPLFAGIYRMGAGLGPATAFLYAGPAINVLAIILTARILGVEMGVARAVGAIVFSVVIGALMAFIFRNDERDKQAMQMAIPEEEQKRTLLQNGLYFAAMIGILVFANWSAPEQGGGLWETIYRLKWVLTAVFATGLAVMLVLWFELALKKVAAVYAGVTLSVLLFPGMELLAFSVGVVGLSLIIGRDSGENGRWFSASWDFAKQIMPLLLAGVFIAGLLLGRVGEEGLIPSHWVAAAVGGNSLGANMAAALAGALMYFATLTEVPILQGLIGSGMGKGPALALLLAGPAVSLPNMLVIRSVIGTGKTVVFVVLVVIMATISGLLYGTFF